MKFLQKIMQQVLRAEYFDIRAETATNLQIACPVWADFASPALSRTFFRELSKWCVLAWSERLIKLDRRISPHPPATITYAPNSGPIAELFMPRTPAAKILDTAKT